MTGAPRWPPSTRCSFAGQVGEFDHPRIVAAVREILIGIGEDPTATGLHNTPERVARAYAEMFQGFGRQPEDVLATVFDLGHDEFVLVKDIEVDIWTGLLGDLPKLLNASEVAAELKQDRIPVPAAVHSHFPEQWQDMALRGGEDYELLFTIPAERFASLKQAALAIGSTVNYQLARGSRFRHPWRHDDHHTGRPHGRPRPRRPRPFPQLDISNMVVMHAKRPPPSRRPPCVPVGWDVVVKCLLADRTAIVLGDQDHRWAGPPTPSGQSVTGSSNVPPSPGCWIEAKRRCCPA